MEALSSNRQGRGLRISHDPVRQALFSGTGFALTNRGSMKEQWLHPDDLACYRICAQGVFDAAWLDLLSEVWTLQHHQTSGQGITSLTGEVTDQAALLGVLQQLYSLGFPLLVVEHLADQASCVGDSTDTAAHGLPICVPFAFGLRLSCAGLLCCNHES